MGRAAKLDAKCSPDKGDNVSVEAVKSSYDEQPYKSSAFANYSLSRLLALRKLLAFESISVATKKSGWRVLEIGCSFGGNLISSALSHPDSEFIGVDLSSEQIKEANRIAKSMDIKNLTFIELDISNPAPLVFHLTNGATADINEVATELKFDFIYCHGVYSWVPDFVKNAILSNGAKLLAIDGMMVISYNTYPGWKHLDIVRDAMLFGSYDAPDDAKARLTHAKDAALLLNASFKNSAKIGSLTANTLAKIADNKYADYYIDHEFLEIFNDPCYFKDFVSSASAAGLMHIVDAELVHSWRNEVKELGGKYSSLDRLKQEQWGDFLAMRTFRHSVLAHQNAITPQMSQAAVSTVSISDIDELHFVAKFERDDDGFKAKNGQIRLPSGFDSVCEAFNSSFPASLNTVDVEKLSGKNRSDTLQIVAQLISINALFMSDRPLKSLKYEPGRTKLKHKSYVEYFANTMNPAIVPASCLHTTFAMSKNEAQIALMFDGKNSFEDISNRVFELAQKSDFVFERVVGSDGTKQKITDISEIKNLCSQVVEQIADRLCANYFFEEI